jgi:hypothetical protein
MRLVAKRGRFERIYILTDFPRQVDPLLEKEYPQYRTQRVGGPAEAGSLFVLDLKANPE